MSARDVGTADERGPVVRRARPRDRDGLAQLHYRNWCETYFPIIPRELHASVTVDERTAFWTHALERASGDGSAWIALTRREIVGLAYGYPSGALSDRVGFVDALHVATSWRRRGIARMLLELTLNDFRSRDLVRADLLVVDGNPATRFYERLRWTAVERLRAPLASGLPEVELVRYTRAL